MPDIARFGVQDAFAAIIPDWTPYRFAFNNPIYFSDPTGLFEDRSVATCPNCPKTPEFQPFIDDPNTEYFYDSETNKVTKVREIEEVIIPEKKKDSTLDNLDFANDRLDNLGDLLSLTKNKGGSIGIWTTPIRNRAFDGINYSKLNIRYYGNNWRGNLSVGRTTSVAKYLKKGSIVGSIIIGIVETGQGLAKDKSDYETKGQTNGRNTVKAATTATAGIVAGIYAGAAFGTAIPIPIVGTIGGAIVGGIAGYLASEATGAAVDAVYDKIEE